MWFVAALCFIVDVRTYVRTDGRTDGRTFLPGLLGHLSGDDLKTADWIRMLFGVVSGVGLGRGMGVLDGGGDRRREGPIWG